MKLQSSLRFTICIVIAVNSLRPSQLASQVHASSDAHHPLASPESEADRVHTDRTFEFTVKAPLNVAGPLFGAARERAWAPGWDPAFVWPTKPKDQRGMVFVVIRGQRTSVWITSAADPSSGYFQYAYVMPNVVATLITIQLTPHGESTHAEVRYERTALNSSANEAVSKMAMNDSRSGPEWESQINGYLAVKRR
jgi:hypothetical protein